MKIFGQLKPLPRLTAWYGDAGARYVYSGIVNELLPWTTAFAEVKHAVEAASGVAFNGVLLNRYRNGQDSMGWHADDEPEFGDAPVIASVSFGGTRNFQLKHKRRKELKASVELTHGSLLIMRGGTQANWLYQIPKTAKPVEERLNLTFRRLLNLARRGEAESTSRMSSQRHRLFASASSSSIRLPRWLDMRLGEILRRFGPVLVRLSCDVPIP